MKPLSLLVTLFLVVISFIACISSQHKARYYDASFEKLDSSGDGTADMDEFRNHFSEGNIKVFIDADADRDGKIYPDEWYEFREKHGYEKP